MWSSCFKRIHYLVLLYLFSAFLPTISKAQAKQVIVWNGELANIGSGWVTSNGICKVKAQTSQAHSGQSAVQFTFRSNTVNSEADWIGAGWNWVNWQIGPFGTDITTLKNFTFWIKTEGQVAEMQFNLLCNGAPALDMPEHHTEKVIVSKYCPKWNDGNWHRVVVPLKDLKQPTGFDPVHVAEMQFFNTGNGDGSFFIDDLAFDDANTTFLQNPVAENGQLQVIGHQLCNENEKPLQLRGMSMFGLMHMPECVTWQSFKLLKDEWQANVIRVPVYMANYSNSNNYNQNPDWNNALIDSTIKWSERLGVYCIIDWHNDRFGSPNDSNHKKADSFFKMMSAKYAGKKNVIYELFNEPYGETVTWDTIASYANRIMPIIRKNDPKAIILIGTPVWDQKLETVDTKKLNDTKNVMYTFHFYANSHQSLYSMFASQIHRIPVFVSEWGTCESSGLGNLDLETSSRFLNTMEQHILGKDTVTISWCNFSYGDKAESTSALKPHSCTDGLWDNTTPGGDFIKYWIKYNNALEINLKKIE